MLQLDAEASYRSVQARTTASNAGNICRVHRRLTPLGAALLDVNDEWELLSDDGFLEISDGGNQIYCRKFNSSVAAAAATVLHTNYFICPSSSPPLFLPTAAANDQPIQINMESFRKDGGGVDQDRSRKFSSKSRLNLSTSKLNRPNRPSSNLISSSKSDKGEFDADMAIRDGEKDDGDVSKWSLNGIDAICSFGVAAATFHPLHQQGNNHNHKLQFRIYSDDKRRMKAKGAIAAVSEVPINRARITEGGYYDLSAAAAI